MPSDWLLLMLLDCRQRGLGNRSTLQIVTQNLNNGYYTTIAQVKYMRSITIDNLIPIYYKQQHRYRKQKHGEIITNYSELVGRQADYNLKHCWLVMDMVR